MITRRQLIKAGAGLAMLTGTRVSIAGDDTMNERIAAIISEYSAQGVHRTGTDVDNASADWLADRISSLGIKAQLDSFTMKRLEVRAAAFRFAGMEVPGVPLYDCHYTNDKGISGSLGTLGSSADIGVVMAAPMGGQGAQVVEAARREKSHKAIVLVTDSRMPPDGVATVNAEAFTKPFGPPVLQVANREWQAIQQAVGEGSRGTVVAQCEYVDAKASNVQAVARGRDPGLAPLVVMTPRSGWWTCASERGGGIAAFLEMMRAIKSAGSARDVIFTANTGHELGHLGLDHYLAGHRSLIAGASMWFHLGANFAARHGHGVRLQYSDDKTKALVTEELDVLKLKPTIETPVGQRPWGEARNIYDGNGRYISILGGNALFHHPDDIWPDAVNLETTTGWVRAFADLSVKFAQAS